MKRYSDVIIWAAKDLRSRGYTYREICEYLDEKIPKGTLSSWFKHITPPPKYYQRMTQLGHDKILLAQKHNQEQLEARLSNLRIKNVPLISKVDKDIGKIILSVLYWCEGNKYPGTRCLRFGNSDPKMIKFFLTLLRFCYQIEESKLRLTVQCRSDQNTATLTNFWEKITQITHNKHYSARFDKRSNGKITRKSNYKGVCVIDYFNTNLQCELQFFGEMLGSDQYIEQMKNQVI